MSIRLRQEQNDYIDKILSKGLDEIKNVPSFNINTISDESNSFNNDDNINLKNNSMNLTQLNLKIPTQSDFNISYGIKEHYRYYKKNSLILNIKNKEESKKEDFFNSAHNKFNNSSNRFNFENYNNINNRIKQKPLNSLYKNEENKENNSNLIIPSNIPNNREIIVKALYNNQKNINKLNKQITGYTLNSSQNKYLDNKSNISASTQCLIDKYIDLKSSIHSKNDSVLSELKDSLIGKINNDNLMTNENKSENNDILNIHDLSCVNKLNDTKNNKYKKYNPKSSALKKLIEKLKKEEEYEESRNKEINNDFNKTNNNISYSNSIQVSSFADSELFTLGNNNITNSIGKTNIKKKKIYKNGKKKKYNMNEISNSKIKKKFKSELNSNILRSKNIRTFDKILDSEGKYNKLNNEIDLIRNKIKKISKSININTSTNFDSLIKKNNSMNSLLNSNYKLKNTFLKFPSVMSMENLSHLKHINGRSTSTNINNYKNIKKEKEEKYFKKKYKELKGKFLYQREKMKNEKEEVISLQQKIKLLLIKFEKLTELVEFNETLTEQNNILLNNLEFSQDVSKKQAKLIEVLQNQIKTIKNL